jgi:predicted nucleotidyltransferase
VGEYLDGRRGKTAERLTALQQQLSEAATLAAGKACVYVTGSFGRGESSEHSDLDLFIVGLPIDNGIRVLRRLDEICIKADLIETTKRLHIPEFSGDGAYLAHYTAHQLIKTLGSSADDATNTFTARLLLLLESRPLVGETVYAEVIDAVIAAYWGDFEDHRDEFVPAFLANDILRLWRTFCVNYEARTSKEPREKRIKRKLKNYKLKHSRLLTCYSALAYLLMMFAKKGTVSPSDVSAMVGLSPVKRLEDIATASPQETKAKVGALLHSYEEFLRITDKAPAELMKLFADASTSRQLFQDANKFGDLMYDLLEELGRAGKRFHRLLTV